MNGRLLRKSRYEQKVTLEVMAKHIGISLMYLDNIELGSRGLRLSNIRLIEKIAAAYKIERNLLIVYIRDDEIEKIKEEADNLLEDT